MQTTRARPHAEAYVLLALPFLVGVLALHGLTHTLPTFHGSDELSYHLPTIRQFADQLPTPDLLHYPTVHTPLYHLGLAGVVKVFGVHLWLLRAITLIASYLAAVVLYRLLEPRVRRWPALALALVFVLTPYVFGPSFILLTDNVALLFGLLCIERLDSYRRNPTLRAFAWACLFACLAVLTRQSYVWLFGVVLIAWRRSDTRELVPLALSVLPPLALFIAWGGFQPVSQTVRGSCSLCGGELGLSTHSAMFTLAVAGFYGALLFGPTIRAWFIAEYWRYLIFAGVIGGLLLVTFPTVHNPSDAGFLWNVAKHLPTLLGSSLLFWVLVPLGVAVLAWRWWDTRDVLALAVFGSFLASTLMIAKAYQKYFDPFVLLALYLTVLPTTFERRRDYLGLTLITVGSAAYALASL